MIKFRKKKGGDVLFDAAKSTTVRRNLREGVALAVAPRIRAIDLWLERARARQNDFVL